MNHGLPTVGNVRFFFKSVTWVEKLWQHYVKLQKSSISMANTSLVYQDKKKKNSCTEPEGWSRNRHAWSCSWKKWHGPMVSCGKCGKNIIYQTQNSKTNRKGENVSFLSWGWLDSRTEWGLKTSHNIWGEHPWPTVLIGHLPRLFGCWMWNWVCLWKQRWFPNHPSPASPTESLYDQNQ